jgi:hypothetical protein
MGTDMRDGGLIDFRFRIDAEDGDGVMVYTLPFKHAVNIIPTPMATTDGELVCH